MTRHGGEGPGAGASISGRILIVLSVLAFYAAAARGEQPPGGSAAREALALCHQADRVPASERSAVLARGLDRAEEAVRVDPEDAVAHFSVFCNLGKRLEMELRNGLGLLRMHRDLDRAWREIDIALALAPDFSAALAAKGAMLAELPRLFGGDPKEGERLLRRAVALDPDDPQARLTLARILEAAGNRQEALAHAEVAVAVLEHAGPPTELSAARALVTALH